MARLVAIADLGAHRRQRARLLAAEAIAAGRPTAWFEDLYTSVDGASSIPWAELTPNPNLVGWLAGSRLEGSGRRALVVGSGLGDDAEALAAAGFQVVAFDIAPTAIAWSGRRFPSTPVDYVVADLFALPELWRGAFDFALEAYTLQVLPAELRPSAAQAIAATLAPGGRLLVISRGRSLGDPGGSMPWPLTEAELRSLFEASLRCDSLEDYLDDEEPPVRRLRAEFAAAADGGSAGTAVSPLGDPESESRWIRT